LDEPVKITPAKMVLLGIGWFGVNVFWGFHSATIPLFLRNFTDSKFMISLILSLPGLAGCIVPPIVGYFSDRTVSRFGRRKPYVFLGMLGVFLCIMGLSRGSVFWVVVLIAALMYFSLRLAETPYLSLLPDITPQSQRSTASGTMNFFGSMGLILYFVISSQVWDSNPTAVFYIVAFAAFVCVLITITFIKEPKVLQIEKPKLDRSVGSSVLSYLKGIVEETNVMKFFVAQFFWWFGFWMVSSFLTLFVVEVFNVAEGKSFMVPMVFSVVATIFMLPMGILGDRFGRKGIISCMIGFWATMMMLITFSQNFWHVLIAVGVSGMPYAAVMGIGYAFMLDLIPTERTAEFVGVSIISIAVAQIFSPLIGGKLIDLLGYRWLFPIAAILMVIGLLILQFVRSRQER